MILLFFCVCVCLCVCVACFCFVLAACCLRYTTTTRENDTKRHLISDLETTNPFGKGQGWQVRAFNLFCFIFVALNSVFRV